MPLRNAEHPPRRRGRCPASGADRPRPSARKSSALTSRSFWSCVSSFTFHQIRSRPGDHPVLVDRRGERGRDGRDKDERPGATRVHRSEISEIPKSEIRLPASAAARTGIDHDLVILVGKRREEMHQRDRKPDDPQQDAEPLRRRRVSGGRGLRATGTERPPRPDRRAGSTPARTAK